MSLLSRLKQKLGVRTEGETPDSVKETEPIHTPSFSIGESLGDIKVALMDLKTRSERIEGAILTRDYLDQAIDRSDKSDLVIGKLDEALRVLAEFQPSKPSSEPRTPSSTE
jgi:hypothetical protein